LEKIATIASATMSGLRQSDLSPSPQRIVAWLSSNVAGQSALAATPWPRTSSAIPCATSVMPNLLSA
jgi:hypothetical protein